MSSGDQSSRANWFLKVLVLSIAAFIFVPLIFQTEFRKFLGIALLGTSYSLFFVSSWNRWMRNVKKARESFLVNLVVRSGNTLKNIVPVRAWGVVPCIIQLLVLGVFFICFWFLGPVIYRLLRNPAVPGMIRDALQAGAPKFFDFLNALASNQNPVALLRSHAQQIFASLNRFVSAIIFPLVFIAFTSIGAALHSSIEELMKHAEGSGEEGFSRILDSYSELFWEYLVYNLLYYLLLSMVVGMVLGILDVAGLTSFGWKFIAGVIVSFVAGNLIIPGFGTLVMTGLVVGMAFVDKGLFWGAGSLAIFGFYFMLDDYVMKPWFLSWIGGTTGREWEFGAEIIIFGVVVLYSAFGLVGALLLFPVLCFTSAYLEHQYPDLQPWVLHPLRELQM